jgi:predicted AlkP superfamily pyrophosphatase or phosphodiesterase
MAKVMARALVLALASVVAWSSPVRAQGGAGVQVEHVVVISIDGLRPDALDRYRTPTLTRLIALGSASLEASTVLPSKTLPSHTSMLTGVGPDIHGITWNRYVRGRGVVAVPTVFELARSHGLGVAAFYAKAKLRHLDRPGSYDHRLAPRWNVDNWLVTDLVPEAVSYIRHGRPNLVFIHVGEPDLAGHVAGWMSPLYGLAVWRADAAVGEIVMAAEAAYGADGFTLIVTSDHGGVGRGHGSPDPLDVTIPWIAYGRGVLAGPAPSGIRTMDTAATVLWLLGIPFPTPFEGRPVVESFRW